jgi:HNH endonuclease
MARRRRHVRNSDTGLIGAAIVFVTAYVALQSAANWWAIGNVAMAAAWVLVLLVATIAVVVAWKPRRAWAVVRWTWGRWRGRRKPANGQPPRPAAPLAFSRQPIPAGLRFAVLKRDGFRCAYCGRGEGDGVKLHIDHLVPVARGGKNDLDNLVTACQDCNLGKSASDLVGAG